MDIRPRTRENYRMRNADEFCGQNEPKRPAVARRLHRSIVLVMCIYLGISSALMGQTSDSQHGTSDKSWTATTDSKEDDANPTRTLETHTQNGNRTVDVRSLQTRGADGGFQPYQDIETETTRVNATTTRTTMRTFVRDSDGNKTLLQVREEEKRILPGGDSKVVRTTSNPDANGNLQIVQRENRETVKTSLSVEETKTTIMLPNISGGLAPAMQIQEREKRNGSTVEIQKTTQLADGNGSWQVAEVRHTTTKDNGKNRDSEERVSRPDLDGNLGEITRTVRKESANVSGDKQESEETYSIDQPGATRDNGLHLVQRVTTTQRSGADSKQMTKVLEQTNPGDPGAGLWVSTVTTEGERLGSTGVQATETIQQRDANGNLDVVSVDITKADSAKAINVQIEPPNPK
jgi:hypothetical protein